MKPEWLGQFSSELGGVRCELEFFQGEHRCMARFCAEGEALELDSLRMEEGGVGGLMHDPLTQEVLAALWAKPLGDGLLVAFDLPEAAAESWMEMTEPAYLYFQRQPEQVPPDNEVVRSLASFFGVSATRS